MLRLYLVLLFNFKLMKEKINAGRITEIKPIGKFLSTLKFFSSSRSSPTPKPEK